LSNILNIEINQSIKPEVEAFYDEDSGSFSCLVKDPESNSCAIIDSVMDIDYPSEEISYKGGDRIIQPTLHVVNPEQPYTRNNVGYMTRRDDQVFLNWINLWIDQMQRDGSYDSLKLRWIGLAE